VMHLNGHPVAEGSIVPYVAGPPGSGKTLLARCTPTILPGMTTGEMLEVSRLTQFIHL
jgi:predicted ATPase with chaperone activity